MQTADILTIGSTLENATFLRLKDGKAKWVPFTSGTSEEVQPLIDGVAEQMDISIDEVTIIAGGVRCAKAKGTAFGEFHSLMSRAATYPEVVRAVEERIAHTRAGHDGE